MVELEVAMRAAIVLGSMLSLSACGDEDPAETGPDAELPGWSAVIEGGTGRSLVRLGGGEVAALLRLDEALTLDDGSTFASSRGRDLLVILDASGRTLAAVQVQPEEGTEDSVQAVRVVATPEGGVLLAGVHTAPFSLGGMSLEGSEAERLWLARLDPAGAVASLEVLAEAEYRWDEEEGETLGSLALADLVAHEDGSLTVAGTFTETLTLADGSELPWAAVRRCGGSGSSGCEDAFLARFGTDAEVRWSQRIAGDRHRRPQRIAALPAGGVALVAEFFETLTLAPDTPEETTLVSWADDDERWDIVLATWDSAGSLRWARHLADHMRDHACGLAVDDEGRILAAGSFTEDAFTLSVGEADERTLVSHHESSRGWLARYTADGELDAAAVVGGRTKGGDLSEGCLAVDGVEPIYGIGHTGTLVFPTASGELESERGATVAWLDEDLALVDLMQASARPDEQRLHEVHEVLFDGTGVWVAGALVGPETEVEAGVAALRP